MISQCVLYQSAGMGCISHYNPCLHIASARPHMLQGMH